MVAMAAATGTQVPLLNCVAFLNDRVQAGDGRVSVDAPSPFGRLLDGLCVPADTLLDALDVKEPSITLEDGKVHIRSGRTHTELDALPADAYSAASAPHGDAMGVLSRTPLERLHAFVGSDALLARVWTTSVLLRAGYAYATNNVVVARTPIDYQGPELAVPLHCLAGMLALPASEFDIVGTPKHLYLRFGECWTRSVVLSAQWPAIANFFEPFPEIGACDCQALLAAVDHVAKRARRAHDPFVAIADGVLLFSGREQGKTKISDVPGRGRWHIDVLQLVLKHATGVAWEEYPRCHWQGAALQGMMAGAPTAR